MRIVFCLQKRVPLRLKIKKKKIRYVKYFSRNAKVLHLKFSAFNSANI